jgi:hypothetical protein
MFYFKVVDIIMNDLTRRSWEGAVAERKHYAGGGAEPRPPRAGAPG